MKTGLHPEYTESKIVCSCGNEWITRSTQAAIKVDVCNMCHPFFTGEQRIIDTAGRVERFRAKYRTSSDS